MHLETLKVSRKTPGDGRLLVTEKTFAALEPLGASLMVRARNEESTGTLHTLECNCTKFGPHPAPHKHHFLQSSVLHSLTPEETVELSLTGARVNVSGATG